VLRQPRLLGSLTALFRDDARLVRTLLTLGALDLIIGSILGFALSLTPWSELPALSRTILVGAVVLGLGDLALAFYADLERPMWRALARGVIVLNLLGFTLLAVLGQAGRL